jgi:hypothetical protein
MNMVSKLKTILVILAIIIGFIGVCKYLPKEITTRYQVITLNGSTFDMDVTVLITDDTAFAAKYVKENLDSTVVSNDFDARGVTFDIKDGKPPIIWMSTDFTDAVASHELLHATIDIMHWANVPLTNDTEETYAYELQYLTNELYKQIKPNK